MTDAQPNIGGEKEGTDRDKSKGKEKAKDNTASVPERQRNREGNWEGDSEWTHTELEDSEGGSDALSRITEEQAAIGFFLPEGYATQETDERPESQGPSNYGDTPSPRSAADVSYWECEACGKYDIPINRNDEPDICPVEDCGHERCHGCRTHTRILKDDGALRLRD